MQAFVTVGSTKFDDLIDAIASEGFLTRLFAGGYTRLVVQYGNSKLHQKLQAETSYGVEVIAWPFKPNLGEEYLVADLVISHAGLRSVCVQFRSLTTCARFWYRSGSVEIE
jgi:beta-1,4-N-acetylglucosaminyltransferase